jgi:hypothetical protein
VLKPKQKLALVLTDDCYIHILTTSNWAIGERKVATGVITPEVCEGWLRDRDCDGDGKIAIA